MSKSGKHGGGFFDADGVAHQSTAFVKRRDKGRAKNKVAKASRKKNRRSS